MNSRLVCKGCGNTAFDVVLGEFDDVVSHFECTYCHDPVILWVDNGWDVDGPHIMVDQPENDSGTQVKVR